MCSVNFLHIGAHPRLPGAGSLPLYKLHFVTVCPARNALMVFGPISHRLLTIHLLVLSLLLLPKLPPQPFGNMLSAKNCPSLLQFREPAVIPREPASIPRSLQGTSGAQPGDWKEGDSIEFSVWESAVGLVFSYLGSFQIAIMPPHVSRAITLRIS